MSRIISFTILIAITLLIGLLFYKVLVGFFIPLFLAVVLVVVFQPLHRWVLSKIPDRSSLAAGITTFLILALLLMPIGLVGVMAGVQGLQFTEQNNVSSIGLQISKLNRSLGLDMPHWGNLLRAAGTDVDQVIHEAGNTNVVQRDANLTELAGKAKRSLVEFRGDYDQDGLPDQVKKIDELIYLADQLSMPDKLQEDLTVTELALTLKSQFGALKTELHGGTLRSVLREVANPTREDVETMRDKAMEYLRPRLLSMTQATGRIAFQLIFGLLILTLAVYFFLMDGPGMIHSIMLLLPMDDAYERELLNDFAKTSRAIVVAMLAAAVVQGLTAGVGYAIAGVDYLVLLIMLTSLAALIPFVGPMVVWVPVCIFLALIEQRWMAAGLLAAWGLLVVGTIDNLVKALVLHGNSQLHPMLALLSILGGIQALGAIGIVIGPMAVSLLQTLLGIVRRELNDFDTQGLGAILSKHKPTPAVDAPASSPTSTVSNEAVNAPSDIPTPSHAGTKTSTETPSA
ncbi:MAG TPA: permease [Planctomycetaceae bacterium]|nr:permease [Planctomycetaceae bacterium]